MFLFNLTSRRRELLKKRYDYLSKLSKLLDSQYYRGISLLKCHFKYLNNTFIKDDCNAIAGNIDGYKFCFIEDYHVKSSRHDSSHWKSKLIIEMKEKDFPDFSLKTKTQAFIEGLIALIATIVCFSIPFFDKNKEFFSLFIIIMGVLSLIPLFCCINRFMSFFQQYKYKISNYRFKKKYVIISDCKPEIIRRVFTDNICNQILNYPSNLDIHFIDKSIVFDFPSDIKLSYNACLELLSEYIEIVKLFEDDSEN